MNTLDPRLTERIAHFRQILLNLGLFDEAHSIGVAINSPKVCDSSYTSSQLRNAATVALQFDFLDVNYWLAKVLLESAPQP